MEKLSGVLFSLYRGSPTHGEWVLACLRGAWPRLLGERLAGVCRPAAFAGATLTIEVIDPQWEEAVRSVRDTLLDRLRAASAGEVDRICIVLAAGPAARD